jgi:hypothetical protein
VKRWLGLSVDFTLQMMLAPGAIVVLRYVSLQTRLRQYVDVNFLKATKTITLMSRPSTSALLSAVLAEEGGSYLDEGTISLFPPSLRVEP